MASRDRSPSINGVRGVADSYWAARAKATWTRRKDTLLPRLSRGESPLSCPMWEPRFTDQVYVGETPPDTEDFEVVLFDYEVCRPRGGSAYWAVEARQEGDRSRIWLMETGPHSDTSDRTCLENSVALAQLRAETEEVRARVSALLDASPPNYVRPDKRRGRL